MFRLREIATNCILTEKAHLFINEISDLLSSLSFLYKRVSLFLQNTTVVSKKGEIVDFCIDQLIKEQCTERNG